MSSSPTNSPSVKEWLITHELNRPEVFERLTDEGLTQISHLQQIRKEFFYPMLNGLTAREKSALTDEWEAQRNGGPTQSSANVNDNSLQIPSPNDPPSCHHVAKPEKKKKKKSKSKSSSSSSHGTNAASVTKSKKRRHSQVDDDEEAPNCGSERKRRGRSVKYRRVTSGPTAATSQLVTDIIPLDPSYGKPAPIQWTIPPHLRHRRLRTNHCFFYCRNGRCNPSSCRYAHSSPAQESSYTPERTRPSMVCGQEEGSAMAPERYSPCPSSDRQAVPVSSATKGVTATHTGNVSQTGRDHTNSFVGKSANSTCKFW